MQLFANRRVRVKPDIITIIARRLAGKGTFLVKEGQEVSPSDIIGRSSLSAGFRTINLAAALEVPALEAKKYLTRGLGARIYKGELLAYKPGKLFQAKKVVASPTDGVIESYSEQTGELRMSFLPRMVDLASSVYGVVEKVNQASSQLLIRTEATQIYGLLGSGRSREGILEMIGTRSGLLDASMISQASSEHIVVGGGLIYNEAIAMAVSHGVSGIITGGINAKDYRAVSGGSINRAQGTDVGISIMVCEGFGSIPMGEDISAQILKFKGKFAILSGNGASLILPSFDSGCLSKIRNTKLPLSSLDSIKEEVEAVELEAGQQVRVMASPFMGDQGKVISVDQNTTLLPSNIATYLVTIETKSRKIKVPMSNIEVI